MKVVNIHEREMGSAPEKVGALIDSLASHGDMLWPLHMWPKMKFDRPLGIGANGGHGPIRYFVKEYIHRESIKFQFTGPKGFVGYHSFEIINKPRKPLVLRHSVIMNTHGLSVILWPLVFEPMHDALIEDSLTRAQESLGQQGQVKIWSIWVKILRWVLSGGKSRSQISPDKATNTAVGLKRQR